LYFLEVSMPRSLSALTIFLFVALAPLNLAAQSATENVLYSFCDRTSCPIRPWGSLIQASDGNFYGTTQDSSFDNGNSLLFRVAADGTFTPLFSFCPTSGNCTNGADVQGNLLQASDDNLYGTAYAGGAHGAGVVFKAGLNGSFSVLHNFCSLANCADGAFPGAGLTLGSDGNFYGVTSGNAGATPQTYGSVFQLTPGGVLTTLHTFCNTTGCTGGVFPSAALVEGADGAFYGTTSSSTADSNGNPDQIGSVFRITTSGTLTVLHTFCNPTDTSCSGGSDPYTGVTLGADGMLYGTTGMGGSAGRGTLYKISTSGEAFTVLNSFCTESNCADGGLMQEPLILAGDGTLYGLFGEGSTNPNGGGELFKVGSSGTNPPVYSFCSVTDCADGSYPLGMVQGSDGAFYGTTVQGGADGEGVIFRVATSPALPPPITVTLSPSTITPGQSSTLTWNVAAPVAINPSMQQCFATGQTGGGSWSGPLTGTSSSGGFSGTATITPTVTGKFTYAVTCGGQTSGFGTLLNGSQATTTTSLTSSVNPVAVGQTTTLTVTVAATGDAPAPTGTVSFYLNGSLFYTVPLGAGGTATLVPQVPEVPAGTYAITAKYSGDISNLGSTSSAVNETVNLAQTVGTITASENPAVLGTPINLTFHISRTNGHRLPAGGTVTLYVNGTQLAVAPVTNGVAQITHYEIGGSLPVGNYTLTCSYSGDTGDAASACTPLVLPLDYYTRVSGSGDVLSGNVHVSIVVYGGSTPTGTVTLSVNQHVETTLTLVNGEATYSRSAAGLPSGTYVVYENYSGDSTHPPVLAGFDLVVP
jgi:uncharacterized repeat protein (TIGR03803 family)